jgi:hypothetical protein
MAVKTIMVKRMPVVLWQRLKAQAALEGRTLQDITSSAIKEYLDAASSTVSENSDSK